MSSNARLAPGPTIQLAPPNRSAALLTLVRRVATEDRAAFAELHDILADRVIERLRSSPITNAMAAATFVEVWWLARYHTAADTDVLAWVTAIAARRSEEYNQHHDTSLPTHHTWIAAGADSYYLWTEATLSELLDPR